MTTSFRANLTPQLERVFQSYADRYSTAKAKILRGWLRMLQYGRNLPFDPSLDDWEDHPMINQICDWIELGQPFEIAYADAAGKVSTYQAHYAQLSWHESRCYLEIWSPDATGYLDIAELGHNRTLRLDRIMTDGHLRATEVPWREEGLDAIEVQFKLMNGLAANYERHPEDLVDTWIDGDRYITRRITSAFWLIRSLLPYGGDCIVLSPDSIVQRIVAQFETALSQYKR